MLDTDHCNAVPNITVTHNSVTHFTHVNVAASWSLMLPSYCYCHRHSHSLVSLVSLITHWCVWLSQVLAARVQHLASVGLLQQQQPEGSQLMVTAANTLPDELLTIIQVS